MAAELEALLNEVRRDLAQAEAEVSKLKKVEEYLFVKIGVNGLLKLTTEPASAPPSVSIATHGRLMPQRLTQKEAAALVLKEAGEPLRTKEIVMRMVRGGYYPDAPERKQLENAVFSVMRRHDEIFAKISPGIWGLVELQKEGKQ